MTGTVTFREAAEADIPAIVALLADDERGWAREAPGDPAYVDAFRAMRATGCNRQILALRGDEIVGCLQLTLTPGLSHRGATRATVEAVRVASHLRGQGIGAEMMRHAMTLAREDGARMMQLTSNVARADAHRFYEGLGFEKSHAGFKRDL